MNESDAPQSGSETPGTSANDPAPQGQPVHVCLAEGEWLAVSTEGFAEQQLGRPLTHLVKEVVQNALDSVGGKGRIEIRYTPAADKTASLFCRDDGPGTEDLSRLNVVFVTAKKDGVTQRGRMGRGFKELLSIASRATVRSGCQELEFSRDRAGTRRVTLTKGVAHRSGFDVSMSISHDDVGTDLGAYFGSFLLPHGVDLLFNDTPVNHRSVHRTVQAKLPTERFTNGRWQKPTVEATVHLVATAGAEVPMIYEMGIPVCAVEWTEAFHVDVQQRVPMNPNRDAVMSGYQARLHRACLPALVTEMTKDRALAAWVGEAARGAANEVQKAVVTRAFGEGVVRAVSTSGRFDHNADAQELGRTVVHTAHMPGGFKELLKQHAPTATVVARKAKLDRDDRACAAGLHADEIRTLDLPARRHKEGSVMEAVTRIGRDVVLERMACAQWFAEAVVECRHGVWRSVPVRVACMQASSATWSINGVLTLSLMEEAFWQGAFAQEAYLILVHELAHNEAFHHGRSFVKEVEAYAGAAVQAMLRWGAEGQRRYPSILQATQPYPSTLRPSDRYRQEALLLFDSEVPPCVPPATAPPREGTPGAAALPSDVAAAAPG